MCFFEKNHWAELRAPSLGRSTNLEKIKINETRKKNRVQKNEEAKRAGFQTGKLRTGVALKKA